MSLLLLLISHVPRMKQHSKHLSITGVLRLIRLRVHLSPHGSVIFGMVLFALSLLCLPSLTSEWRASDVDHFEQEVDPENNSKGHEPYGKSEAP
jgi:hypothetical protein